MSCDKYHKLISSSLDDELSRSEREALSDHLDQCDDCRALSLRLGRGLSAFTALEAAEPAPELSPYLAERISARAVEQAAEGRPWLVRLAVSFGAAALVMGLAIGFAIRPHLTGPEPGDDRLNLSAIRFSSPAMGVEIEEDRFVLHSKDRKGKSGVDLKF